MPKFACTCGHTVDLVPCPSYLEGWLIPDSESERAFDPMLAQMEDFLQACLAGQRDAWVQRFYDPYGEAGIDDRAVIHDIVWGALERVVLDVVQCEVCRRIWIEDEAHNNSYRAWTPEGHTKHVLGWDDRETVETVVES